MPNRLHLTASTEDITICSAASSLPFPPTAAAVVSSAWNTLIPGVIPKFDLEIWSTGTLSLTTAELFGGKLRTLVNADDVFTATHGTETFTAASHGLFTGDGPFNVSSDTTLPSGLSTGTNYWIVKVDANDFKLATSFANAMAQTPTTLSITSDGAGTHTLSDLSTTKRVYWHSHGALSSSISLTNQRAYTVRCEHRPQVVVYAVVGTLSAGTVSAAVVPVLER